MRDRIFIQNLKCAYCDKPNNPDGGDFSPDGVYYAPSSGVDTFLCEYCRKENKIVESFKAVKK